ncbi:MAG: hypothetical protein SGILL_010452, partial [Bacillariaceae sp.]
NCADDSQKNNGRRLRKHWKELTGDEQENLIKAIEASIESGQFAAFSRYHADRRSAFQSHATCAFALWHRRFLLAMENMLRSTSPTASCVTIPYWDISADFQRQSTGLCFSFASCAPGLFDVLLGGVPGLFVHDNDGSIASSADQAEEGRFYLGSFAMTGLPIRGRPVANITDDRGRRGIVRNDIFDVPIPESADAQQQLGPLIRSATGDTSTTAVSPYSLFADFTRILQEEVHDDVHNSIGGVMPTYVSTLDPAFMIWHSTVDWYMSLWETCHSAQPRTTVKMGEACMERAIPEEFREENADPREPPPEDPPEGVAFLPGEEDIMIMQLRNGNDIREDELIGRYFQDIGLVFEEVADTRSLDADNAFLYQVVIESTRESDNAVKPSSGSLWEATLALTTEQDVCVATERNPSILGRDFEIIRRAPNTVGAPTYPYADLEASIAQWLALIFPLEEADEDRATL